MPSRFYRFSFLLFLVLGATACKCPPGVSENAANVERLVTENNAALNASGRDPVIINVKRQRNQDALDLADKMSEFCR